MQFHIHKKYVIVLLTILAVVLVALVSVFVKETYDVSQARIINRERFMHLQRVGPLGPDNVSMIQSWMTFDYVNKVFNLPPDYLQSTLSITDTHYPHLSIVRYGQESLMQPDVLIGQIQDAVRAYFSMQQQPQ